MLIIDWDAQKGWANPKIVPREPMKIATTATSLHYGISSYEGISMVKNAQTGIPQAFKAENNLKSFLKASVHLDMPSFEPKELLPCLKKLVMIDQDWFPDLDHPSQLYVRLCHISTDEVLGVKTPKKTRLFAIINPTTLRPKTLKLKCSTHVYKNWPLGHGSFRVASNYGPLVPTIMDAKNNGFDDVLWLLDGYIKEMTFINVYMLWKSRYGQKELITPPNDGCIFNGSIRKTIIELGDEIHKETGVRVVERNFSIQEMISANQEGRLIEFFGGATQCNIQPISRIVYEDQTIDLKETAFASYLNSKLTTIMSGPANHKWITSVA